MSCSLEVYGFISETYHYERYLPANGYVTGARVGIIVWVNWDNYEYQDDYTPGTINIGGNSYNCDFFPWNEKHLKSGRAQLYLTSRFYYTKGATTYSTSNVTVSANYPTINSGTISKTVSAINVHRKLTISGGCMQLKETGKWNYYVDNTLGATNLHYKILTSNGNIIQEGTPIVDGNTQYFYLNEEQLEIIYKESKSELNYHTNNGEYMLTSYVYFVVQGTYGGKTYTSVDDWYVEAEGKKPNVTFTHYDTNENVLALTGSNQKYVRYISKPHISAAWVAYSDAYIIEKSIIYNRTQIAPTDDFTIENFLDGYLKFSAMDSNYLTANVEANLDFIYYNKPSMTIKGEIDLNGGLDITITGQVWEGNFGLVTNSTFLKYRYKKSGGTWSNWAEIIPKTLNSYYTINAHIDLGNDFNYRETYIIQSYIEDKAYSFYSPEISIAASPIFDWSHDDFNFNVPVTINGGNVLVEDVLFFDDYGESGAITIDGYFSKYDYLEIYFHTQNANYCSVKILPPPLRGPYLDLSVTTVNGSTLYLDMAKYEVKNDNTLSCVMEKYSILQNGNYLPNSNGGYTSINKIVGYRKV